MKFVASLLSHNEMKRFLPLTVAHLLTFVDEIRVLDDGSSDGSYEWLSAQEGVQVRRNRGPGFFHDESMIRNSLLDWTFQGHPTHVLAIDSDEFVTDGRALRSKLKQGEVWGLTMREVWNADLDHLWVRRDGGWREQVAPIVYAVPRHRNELWKIQNRKLSCGRVPIAIQRSGRKVKATDIDILHFGWTRKVDRPTRYARYAEHDRGRFHASVHLRSIMFEDQQVQMAALPWPESLPKEKLLERLA